MKYILAFDQGTTSSRAILFDANGEIQQVAQQEFKQLFPQAGWVEHDPEAIWTSQINAAAEVMSRAGLPASDIAAIGIANQRETTLLWDRQTGEPIGNAIVWQDRRTASICDQLKNSGYESTIQDKTGLVIDAYFSATKIKWMLDHLPNARQKANAGNLCFGTVDSWLVWKLTQGKKHITDITNASRTMLFNIHTRDWDEEILHHLEIPRSLLPNVMPSSEVYGETSIDLFDQPIPIAGIAGDQHAALFGQMCTEKGLVKSTYGTGSFILLNTGSQAMLSKNNLLSTIAWQIGDHVDYALEGSIFIAGAVVQWLRDSLGIIRASEEIEDLAKTVDDNGGIYFVPAFAGLGAPHWDSYARGMIAGITRGTTSGHLARAALESIAYQVADVIEAMQGEAAITIPELRVDGGATGNHLLLQFQSDILGVPIVVPKVQETTALGAAYLAGLAAGYWKNIEALASQWAVAHRFEPSMDRHTVHRLRAGWQKALERAKHWEDQ